MSTAIAVKERPILFSGPMVRAILEGRKAQTRRVMKPQPGGPLKVASRCDVYRWNDSQCTPVVLSNYARNFCPYGVVGDRLWVREKWAPSTKSGNRQVAFEADGSWGSSSADFQHFRHGYVVGVADKVLDDWKERRGHWVGRSYFGQWKPSIYMPRAVSRITLEIVNIRAERLQDISESDARSEGCESTHERAQACADSITRWGIPCTLDKSHLGVDSTLPVFQQLWHTIHAADGQNGWDANPWVWAITFKKCG